MSAILTRVSPFQYPQAGRSKTLAGAVLRGESMLLIVEKGQGEMY